MQNEEEVLKRKTLAIYQLLLGFVIVDGHFRPEEEEIIIEYIMQNYNTLDKTEISIEDQIMHLSNEEDNFANNALAIRMTSNKEELVELILFISQILFADKEFSQHEYELLTKLMNAWNINKFDLKR